LTDVATYIALLRGINVVGSHRLPMQDLKGLLEKSGCAGVQTYIQSGNAIFQYPASDVGQLAKRLGAAVLKRHGFEPRVFVLSRAELARAVAANPFPQADAAPKTLHLFFLSARPAKSCLAAMEAFRTPNERVALVGRTFYLLTPDGFGTSRLAQRAERLLGVEATARNWRTVKTLLAMAD
jgi:uncharacterized protein (DUF1697 family)